MRAGGPRPGVVLRGSVVGLLTAVLVVLVAGCGAERTAAPRAAVPTVPVAPTAAIQPLRTRAEVKEAAVRARVLSRLQRSIAATHGVSIRITGTGPRGSGRTSGISDLSTGDFDVTVAGRLGVIRVKRVADLTWTKAPPAFWVGLGYAADPRRQRKWVVARVADVQAFVSQFDPGVALRTLESLDARQIVSRRSFESGPWRGLTALGFRDQAGGRQTVLFRDGRHPGLVQVRSRRGRALTVLSVVALPAPVVVAPPPAAEVLQPQ